MPTWLQTMLALCAGFAPVFSVVVVLWARFTQREGKTLDALLHCHQRYDALWELRRKISEGEAGRSETPELFFQRFYGLQFDQFYLFCIGYVPIDVYLSWVRQRFAEMRGDALVAGCSFSDGWEHVRDRYAGSAFARFFEEIRMHPEFAPADLRSRLKSIRKESAKRTFWGFRLRSPEAVYGG